MSIVLQDALGRLELRMDTLEGKLDKIVELLEKKATDNKKQVHTVGNHDAIP